MNWRNYRIVRFNNGMYGIRKGWIIHTFYDMKDPGYWWFDIDNIKKYSATMTEQETRDHLDKLLACETRKYYEVIK